MKISKEAAKMAKDLNLSDVDAYIIELKTKLYVRSSKLIKESKLNHLEIAKLIGTSRSRINRIANMGENSVSLEILLKLIAVLQKKPVIKIVD